MSNSPIPNSALNMEKMLQLRQLGSDTFVAVQKPWLPPGAPSIYGGTLVAHCVLAAAATVSGEHMRLASLHCTFVEGGKPDAPIYYIVERTNKQTVRSIRAFQEMRCIFIAALRFEPRSQLCHNPSSESEPDAISPMKICVKGGGGSEVCPFVCSNLTIAEHSWGLPPQDIRITQRMKTRQSMATDDRTMHMAAVAYMSDNYFLPTAARVHGLSWERDPENLPASLAVMRRGNEDMEVKMMVSLDHSLYFVDRQDHWRADEWMNTEMVSPWAGNGRGLVLQKIYARDGTLICTAVQEVCPFCSHRPAD